MHVVGRRHSPKSPSRARSKQVKSRCGAAMKGYVTCGPGPVCKQGVEGIRLSKARKQPSGKEDDREG